MSDLIVKTGDECMTCRTLFVRKVIEVSKGFCVISACRCGPYARESAIYFNRETAEKALKSGKYERM